MTCGPDPSRSVGPRGYWGMTPASGPAVEAIKQRKRQHVDLALADASQGAADAGWSDVHLVPAALPEVSFADLDLGTSLFGKRLALPIVLAAMTGGHDDAVEINAVLGSAAQHFGLAVGVGSQRAALADPSLERSYAAVRDRAPDAVVIANIGACQLVDQGQAFIAIGALHLPGERGVLSLLEARGYRVERVY